MITKEPCNTGRSVRAELRSIKGNRARVLTESVRCGYMFDRNATQRIVGKIDVDEFIREKGCELIKLQYSRKDVVNHRTT